MTLEGILFIVVPVAILNIILFFKIWGMTNNTKKIRAFLEAQKPDLLWQTNGDRYVEKKEE